MPRDRLFPFYPWLQEIHECCGDHTMWLRSLYCMYTGPYCQYHRSNLSTLCHESKNRMLMMKVEGKLGLTMQGVGGTIAKCQDIEQRFHWTINDSDLTSLVSFIHSWKIPSSRWQSVVYVMNEQTLLYYLVFNIQIVASGIDFVYSRA